MSVRVDIIGYTTISGSKPRRNDEIPTKAVIGIVKNEEKIAVER